MDQGLNFDLPQKFIQVKKNQRHENKNMGQFINNLYTNYNFQFESSKYKKTQKLRTKNDNTVRKKREKPLTEEEKRLRKIKSLMRESNLEQKSLLDFMKCRQTEALTAAKLKIKYRMKQGIDIEHSGDKSQLIDVIDIETGKKQKIQHKNVMYVDMKKINVGECISVQDQAEIDAFRTAKNLIPFQDSHKNKKVMYDFNKALHEKDTYRFNVLWWDTEKKTQEQKRSDKLHTQEQKDRLDPQVAKSLKRQLKPLRKHKLIATRYAPLAEFMQHGMFEKDGIRDGKMIDSSESEDEAGRFEYYDNQADGNTIIPGTIDLENPKANDENNREEEINQNDKMRESNLKFDLKTRRQTSSDQPHVENRLKKALKRMKAKNWKQDRLFTKGMDEDKPISLEDFQ